MFDFIELVCYKGEGGREWEHLDPEIVICYDEQCSKEHSRILHDSVFKLSQEELYLALQAKCKQKQICLFFLPLFHLPVFWKSCTPQFYHVNMWHTPQEADSHWGLYATRKESSLTMRFLDKFAWLIIIKEISFFYSQIVHTWAELSRVEPTVFIESFGQVSELMCSY